MPNPNQLTDKERITQLEKELAKFKSVFEKMKVLIGITEDSIVEPIKPLKIE